MSDNLVIKRRSSNSSVRLIIRIICLFEILAFASLGSTGSFILSLMPAFALCGLITSLIRSPTWLVWVAGLFAVVPIVVGFGAVLLIFLIAGNGN